VPEATRILLIDDHVLFREAIARLLASQGDLEIVAECATVEEGIAAIKDKAIDIVLLDISLGSQQGGAFLNLAKAEGFAGQVLVVTAGVSRLEAARLMQRGCAGIILKHERPQLLIESIRSLTRANMQPSPAAAATTALKNLQASGQHTPNPLTRRERQVLRGVFGGQANKEIAFSLGISEPLVKSVMQQLFTKTGVRNRTQLIRIAVERYWQELEEEAEAAPPS
jgi:DNA-binding NarL/FixJ family response regulator